MSILVIDVGTSAVRAAVVRPDASVVHEVRRPTLPDSPVPGPRRVRCGCVRRRRARLRRDRCWRCRARSRASESRTSGPAPSCGTVPPASRSAPAQGWQDLRTVGDCLVLASDGLRLAPNQSATKLANILDSVDPERRRDLCFGTPESWIIWKLTDGAHHVADLSNAAVWGLLRSDASHFDERVLDKLRIPASVLPRIVDSTGPIAEATALAGAPLICGVAGDQQSSLIGQGCVEPRADQDHLRDRRHVGRVPRSAVPSSRRGVVRGRSPSCAGGTRTAWSGAPRR